MRKLKFKGDRKPLEIMFFTFIKPLLEYASVVWDNCTQYEKVEFDKIQNEAARIVTGTTKSISIQAPYEDISMLLLAHNPLLLLAIQRLFNSFENAIMFDKLVPQQLFYEIFNYSLSIQGL